MIVFVTGDNCLFKKLSQNPTIGAKNHRDRLKMVTVYLLILENFMSIMIVIKLFFILMSSGQFLSK